MILNAIDGKPLPVYGDGNQIRDWLFVDDHCEAILRVLKDGRLGEVYNVGGDNQPTNLEIIDAICAILDERLPDSPHVPHKHLVQFVPDRPGHDRRYAMNIEKIDRELNWQPAQSLQSGLEKTIDWYLENEAWVKAIREQLEYQQWVEKNYERRE